MSFIRNRAALHAALPLAACAAAALSALAAPSASAQALEAHRIVIDPYTGRARLPEHDELAAAKAKAQAARAASRTASPDSNAVQSALRSHPAAQLMTAKPLNPQLGAKGSRVDASRLSFSVARRNADGTLSTQCVTGDDAASKTMHGTLVENNMTTDRLMGLRRAGAAIVLSAAGLMAAHAATIQVINIDEPGVGFNETTPAQPVGGNPGTTVGEQRQIVFAFVADFWGRRLRSDIPIQVLATFAPLDCDATSGVLGAAGAYNVFADFPNGKPGTWYPGALANKLSGVKLEPNPDPFVSADIISFFNGDLGKPGCLEGLSFYLGLDGKPDNATQIDLVTTVLHEFGHGLGVQTFTDDGNGQPFLGLPSIFDDFLFDPQQRKTWTQMTDAERVTSAITPRNLVWNGKQVTKSAHKVLNHGTPELFVAGGGLNKFYANGPAEFGPEIDKRTLIASELVHVVDQANGRGLACVPLDAANAKLVEGKVAVIDRGTCAFTVKVKNAQLAGAKAVVIADNAPGTPPQPLAGIDPTITIPSLRVSLDDGTEIKNAIVSTPPKRIGPIGVLFENQLKLQGADYLQRVFMFTPNPNQPGSSVSHYDTLAKPNLLMEPFLTPNQPIAVSPPNDLTLPLLLDIGWGN